MKYRSGAAFRQAFEQRLLGRSRDGLTSVVRLPKAVVFDRLLLRLALAAPSRWVLKGALALDFRLEERTRTTKDMDLVRGDNERAATSDLIAAQAIDLDDFFTFARASSGSRSSINSIEPLMSANSAVTVLRSPCGRSSLRGDGLSTKRMPGCAPACGTADARSGFCPWPALSRAPHCAQNFAWGGLAAPQAGQARLKAAPHSIQNRAGSGFSVPQLEQEIIPAPECRQDRFIFVNQRRSAQGRDGSPEYRLYSLCSPLSSCFIDPSPLSAWICAFSCAVRCGRWRIHRIIFQIVSDLWWAPNPGIPV